MHDKERHCGKVQGKTGFNKKDSAELVELVFEILKDTVADGEKIRISGFGNFEVKRKADRRGRNPQTGEEIIIVARCILTFKASTMLRPAVNVKS